MGRWVLILLAVMVVAAIVGFVVDAVRVLAGIAFVVALALLVGQWLMRRLGR
ncbi:MAG: hypothetical protein WCY15_16560 [Phenylobacterium sp.]|jgi:hypothetical protein|uniref:hypothetical protein n=1 Tax=Phenylobacterium sp. TaxID=1871053 RepID=UPI002A2EEEC2|nr:hypothetical protein [Phenylobacterium sp.]MDD3838492.1 hypothetical protein [Phenylobacterium sp.]MDX9999292.1 hypothetical protein [Phenylobacterium sp.]